MMATLLVADPSRLVLFQTLRLFPGISRYAYSVKEFAVFKNPLTSLKARAIILLVDNFRQERNL